MRDKVFGILLIGLGTFALFVLSVLLIMWMGEKFMLDFLRFFLTPIAIVIGTIIAFIFFGSMIWEGIQYARGSKLKPKAMSKT